MNRQSGGRDSVMRRRLTSHRKSRLETFMLDRTHDGLRDAGFIVLIWMKVNLSGNAKPVLS